MLAAPMAPDQSHQVPNVVVLEIERDHIPANDKGDYKEVHWITYAIKGTNGATVRDKASRLEKTRANDLWPVIGPVYERWLKGQEEPAEGTPLEAWPAVTKGQVKLLRDLHIRSVEDAAQLNEAPAPPAGQSAASSAWSGRSN